MNTQKLCPECEAANRPYAAICGNCGYQFSSVPPSPPPDTEPSAAAPRVPEYHSPYPLPPPPQRQLTKRHLFYAVVGLLFLLIVAGALAAGISPSPLTTTKPVPGPPIQAPIAASTPTPSASPITPAETPTVPANPPSAAQATGATASALPFSLTPLSGPNSGVQTYTVPSVVGNPNAYPVPWWPEAKKIEPQNVMMSPDATTDVTSGTSIVKTAASPNTTGIPPTDTPSTGAPDQSVTVSGQPTAQDAGWNTNVVQYSIDGKWKTDTTVNANGNEEHLFRTNEATAGEYYQHATYEGNSAYSTSMSNVVNVTGSLNLITNAPTTTSVGGTPPVTVEVTTAVAVDMAT